ncbi:hypothetical protein CLCR_03215 [Cladophialophora carrionii]|uniref:Uncharacterized protein n=1 Tax=Cladophialophora carrionii TaxID=86049 RepID=A0A1C1D1Z9_9EURO|nr:hypothetical protein CLCR_03215 [Cladophialophora carrionii]
MYAKPSLRRFMSLQRNSPKMQPTKETCPPIRSQRSLGICSEPAMLLRVAKKGVWEIETARKVPSPQDRSYCTLRAFFSNPAGQKKPKQ